MLRVQVLLDEATMSGSKLRKLSGVFYRRKSVPGEIQKRRSNSFTRTRPHRCRQSARISCSMLHSPVDGQKEEV